MVTARQPGMTLGDLRRELAMQAHVPDDMPVLVHATDRDGNEAFAALKHMCPEPTCDDFDVFRMFADQEDDG